MLVHHRVTPNIKFASTYLYSRVYITGAKSSRLGTDLKRLVFTCVWKNWVDTGLLSTYTRFFCFFSFRNLREYLLANYLNSFWHKKYFIHRILKLRDSWRRRLNMAASDGKVQKTKWVTSATWPSFSCFDSSFLSKQSMMFYLSFTV